MEIHTKIKGLREQKKITQEEMAYQLGIKQNTYCAIETGQSKLKVEHALKIAEILDLSINELFDNDAKQQNITGNTIEDGGQLINLNHSSIENVTAEKKEMLDFLKNLVETQLDKKDVQISTKDEQISKKDKQISIQLEQINRLIKVLENK